MDHHKANKSLYYPPSDGDSMLPLNRIAFNDSRVKQMISKDNYFRLSPKLTNRDQMVAFDGSESNDINMLGTITTEFIIENAEQLKKIRSMLLDS